MTENACVGLWVGLCEIMLMMNVFALDKDCLSSFFTCALFDNYCLELACHNHHLVV